MNNIDILIETVEKTKIQTPTLLDVLTEWPNAFLPFGVTNVKVQKLRLFANQGLSSTIYTFLLSYSHNGSVYNDNLVLRVYNKGFETTGFKEFTLLKVLHERNLPVLHVYLYEASNSELGKAFLIMEKIGGNIASYFLNDENSPYYN